jgi:hypothetical protein
MTQHMAKELTSTVVALWIAPGAEQKLASDIYCASSLLPAT